MPRTAFRPVALFLAVLAATAFPSLAGAEPPNPFDLVRGLRENGLTDLAMEYLDREAGKNPSPEVQLILPLERGKVKLAVAEDESDDAERDKLVAEAQKDFRGFIQANSAQKHPRLAEAA